MKGICREGHIEERKKKETHKRKERKDKESKKEGRKKERRGAYICAYAGAKLTHCHVQS